MIPQVYLIDGDPINPGDLPEGQSLFKGRLEILHELEGAIGGPRHSPLLLTGARRSGKSSLLWQLLHKLGAAGPVHLP